MGLRTEIQIDGDKCKSCGSLLASEGIVLDRYRVVEDGMITTMVGMLCRHCFGITEIPYWGELLSSARTKVLKGPLSRHPQFACAQTLRE